ncbi:phage protein Gp36 family protein [Croceivirga sp. JEA036]|uniref:phage protein Gp36 family protein n=1 Tax=Croceivirga sp. JEA036 TaxID=2721162 RepID=UPI001438B93E|nr:phage protein Gp36 family protein [Croceivirga sp. JEA036]NJB36381.1 DUF1320 family protein [Croceivirga sp. JEA036]
MVTRTDFDTHLYAEILTAIDRGDTSLLTTAINAALGEAKGYLSRFDVDALFAATGEDRDATLLLYLKDIAVWHFIPLANPNTDMALRRTRYEDAIRWLTDIQRGKIYYADWPVPTTQEQGEAIIAVSSRPRRTTNW